MKPCDTHPCISVDVEFYPPTEILNNFVSIFLTHALKIYLFYFTKPTKCIHSFQNIIVFYHSNKFQHHCAIFREFLHEVLN